MTHTRQSSLYAFLHGHEVAVRLLSLVLLLASTLLAFLWMSGAKVAFAPWIAALNALAAIGQGAVALADRSKPKTLRDMSREEMLALVVASHPRNDWIRTEYRDRTVSSYRPDPQLRFENQHGDGGVENNDFIEPWANGFPNPRAVAYRYGLSYGSSLLREVILVAVDGGRCLLPMPSSESELIVHSFDYRVAQIHEGSWDLEKYMHRAGLKVADESTIT